MSFLILPTREFAEEFKESLEAWCGRQTLMVEHIITDAACQAVIRSMVEEIIDQRMRWIHNGLEHVRGKTREVFPFIAKKDLYDALYVDVLEPFENRIDDLLEGFVPHRTWRIFYVRAVGPDTLLERGIDYRIFDWQRRRDAGEILLEG